MIEIITLSIITGLSSFAFGYLVKSHNESGWKRMYLDEQKKRVEVEKSWMTQLDYINTLEKKITQQQKIIEKNNEIIFTHTGKEKAMQTLQYAGKAMMMPPRN